LKNKVQFVTFPFFFMVELQNFLNAPRNIQLKTVPMDMSNTGKLIIQIEFLIIIVPNSVTK